MIRHSSLSIKKVAPYQFSEGGRFMDNFTDIHYNDGVDSYIELVFMGDEVIPDNIIATWENQKNKEFPKLRDSKLPIIQGSKNEQVDQLRYVNDLYESQKNQIMGKDDKIVFLETELTRLKKLASQQIPFRDVTAKAKVNCENLVSLEYDNALITDFKKIDTVSIFQVQWAKGLGAGRISAENKRLHQWLKIRLKDSTVQLRD